MAAPVPSTRTTYLFAGVTLALLCAAAVGFMFVPGTDDMEIWARWMKVAAKKGPLDGFGAVKADYPPLTFLALWAAEHLVRASDLERESAIKALITCGLGATCSVFWLCSRTWMSPAAALLWAASLGWVLVLESVGLGYLDVLFAPFLLGAIHCLDQRRGWWAALLFFVSVSLKWQPLVLGPYFGLVLLKRSRAGEHSGAVAFAVVGCAVLALSVGVYGEAFVRAFRKAMTHRYLSGDAMNFGWILTHGVRVLKPGRFGPLDDGLARHIFTDAWRFKLVPRVLFVGFYAWALWSAWKDRSRAGWLRWMVVGYLAYFTFNVGVHENHLFIGALLAVFGASRGWFSRAEFLPIVVGLNLNLVLFYGFNGSTVGHGRVIGSLDLALVASCIWVGWFVWWCARQWKCARGTSPSNAYELA